MRCAVWTLAVLGFGWVASACGDADETTGATPSPRAASAPSRPEGATLVLTNADGSEEKVPYRECSAREHEELTALVGAIVMKAVGDAPGSVRQGGFATKLHVAVRKSGALVFGDAATSCGGEPCPREEERAIEALARQAVAQASLHPPPTAACVTSINLRMQGGLGP